MFLVISNFLKSKQGDFTLLLSSTAFDENFAPHTFLYI